MNENEIIAEYLFDAGRGMTSRYAYYKTIVDFINAKSNNNETITREGLILYSSAISNNEEIINAVNSAFDSYEIHCKAEQSKKDFESLLKRSRESITNVTNEEKHKEQYKAVRTKMDKNISRQIEITEQLQNRELPVNDFEALITEQSHLIDEYEILLKEVEKSEGIDKKEA